MTGMHFVPKKKEKERKEKEKKEIKKRTNSPNRNIIF